MRVAAATSCRHSRVREGREGRRAPTARVSRSRFLGGRHDFLPGRWLSCRSSESTLDQPPDYASLAVAGLSRRHFQLVGLHREPLRVLPGGVDIAPSGLRFEGRGDCTPGVRIRGASLGGGFYHPLCLMGLRARSTLSGGATPAPKWGFEIGSPERIESNDLSPTTFRPHRPSPHGECPRGLTATHESRRSPLSRRVGSPSRPASEPWPRRSHSAGTTAGTTLSQGCGVIVAKYVLSLSVAVVWEKNDANVVPIELRPS